MQRFFFSHLPLGKDITISEASFVHQLSRVLRSVVGETVILFNGDGREYIYAITDIGKKEIRLSFERDFENTADLETVVRLYQAMPNKYEKIEYILQKGTEVGVREFVFFRSERSQKLIMSERKMERFREIVREATEQCGGNRVPSVVFFEEKILVPENGKSFVLHTEGKGSRNISDISEKMTSINIFV